MFLKKINTFFDFIYQMNGDSNGYILYNHVSPHNFISRNVRAFSSIILGYVSRMKHYKRLNYVISDNLTNRQDFSPSELADEIEDNDKISGFFKYNFNLKEIIPWFYEKYYLPNDFLERMKGIISSNKKLIKPIMDKFLNGKDLTIETLCRNSNITSPIIFAFGLFDDKPNILAWVLRMYYEQAIDGEFMTYLYNWLETNSNSINKLSKKTFQSYKNYQDILLLKQEMERIKVSNIANSIINKFNTKQKNLLKQRKFTETELYCFCKFKKLSEVKQLNFIKKVSNIDDIDEIMKLFVAICQESYDWNRISLLEFLEDSQLNYKIVYDNNNIVVIQAKDYNTINKAARTTNWCISKQKKYWKDYIESYNGLKKQYVIFNFNFEEDNDLSIIGLTTFLNGEITHAHSFVNNNLFENSSKKEYFRDNIFNVGEYSIDSILKCFGLNKNIFISEGTTRFEWNKESFLQMIKDNEIYYEVIGEKDEKLLVLTNNVMYGFDWYFKEECRKNISDYFKQYGLSKVILYIDFSKKINEDNSSLFILIKNNFYNSEYVFRVMDIGGNFIKANVNKIFEEFSISLNNILINPDTIASNFLSAILSKDFKTIDEYIKEYGIDLLTCRERINSEFYNLIDEMLNDYYDDSIIDIVYHNGYHLSDIFINEDLNDLIFNIFDACNYYNELEDENISKEEIEKCRKNPYYGVYKKHIFYIMSRLFLKKILTNEHNETLLTALFSRFHIDEYSERTIEKITKFIINNFKELISSNENLEESLFNLIFSQNYENLIQYILDNHQDLITSRVKKIGLITLEEGSKFYNLIENGNKNFFISLKRK